MPSDPFSQLQELDVRARAAAKGLPQEDEVHNTWLGVGFRMGPNCYLTPLDEIAEITPCPVLSRVPGTKHWLRGIANLRGRILPVSDLQGYLTHRLSIPSPRSRVLVIDHGGLFGGVLVDEVLGLKHFLEEKRTGDLPAVDEHTANYLRGSFARDDTLWAVFSLHALAETPAFIQVAM